MTDPPHHHAALVDPALGQVVLEAADAVEVGVEPAAGDGLDLVQHELAVAEGEEGGGLGAELQGEVADEQAHVGDAGEPHRPTARRVNQQVADVVDRVADGRSADHGHVEHRLVLEEVADGEARDDR